MHAREISELLHVIEAYLTTEKAAVTWAMFRPPRCTGPDAHNNATYDAGQTLYIVITCGPKQEERDRELSQLLSTPS